MAKDDKSIELRVQANLHDATGAEPPRMAAYAYSRGGKLLDHKALDDKGAATLRLPVGAEATTAPVLVGPAAEEPDLEDLLRAARRSSTYASIPRRRG